MEQFFATNAQGMCIVPSYRFFVMWRTQPELSMIKSAKVREAEFPATSACSLSKHERRFVQEAELLAQIQVTTTCQQSRSRITAVARRR